MKEQFEVWAPFAREVQVVVDSTPHDMHPDPSRNGWWVYEQRPEAGQKYAFLLYDGSAWTSPLPDPRTRLQPEGLHGPSEVVGTDFAWTDGDWRGIPLKDQVLYELHVGTFTPEGTLDAAAAKLDHLAELGVNSIELMPLQPFGGDRNWGYDGVDWFAVHAAYGGPEGLKRFIDTAHARGFAVILDVVYNHFGPEGNYNPFFGPYITAGNTDWGNVINISGAGSDEVRSYIVDAVRQWLGEFHADGLRLDAVQAYDDRRAYSIMEEIRWAADEIAEDTGVPRTIIGETDQNDPRIVNDESRGGYGLTAHWLDDVHHAVHSLTTGEQQSYYVDYGTVEDLADTLKNAYRFRDSYSQYRGRTHGRELDLEHVAPWRMVTYTTNHDQTGNRGPGDRPSQNLKPEKLALRAATVLLSPFTPMLFMGEEFGARTPFPFFVSHSDTELNRLTREGRMLDLTRAGENGADAPDPAAPETFETAKLDWEFDEEQQSLFDAYKRLLALRREHGLSRDDLRTLEVDNGEQWLTMREAGRDVVFAANFSGEEVTVPVGGSLIYSFTNPRVGEAETVLDPWGFAVLATS